MNKSIGCFNCSMSMPDKYNQIHADFEIPLHFNGNEGVTYFELSINEEPPQLFHFRYYDAGTIGHAASQNKYAIAGVLTNLSIDWGNLKETDKFRLFHVNGLYENNKCKLYIWNNKN